jgi:hypothetical protein
MITDTEIKLKGIEALVMALGEVKAERFITLVLREPFDYTLWQRNMWQEKTVNSLSREAMAYRQSSY